MHFVFSVTVVGALNAQFSVNSCGGP